MAGRMPEPVCLIECETLSLKNAVNLTCIERWGGLIRLRVGTIGYKVSTPLNTETLPLKNAVNVMRIESYSERGKKLQRTRQSEAGNEVKKGHMQCND